MKPPRWQHFLGAAALSGFAVITVWSQGRVPPRTGYQAWLTYFRGPEGLQTLDQCKGSLNDVSLFALQFDGQGAVVPASLWVTDTLAKVSGRKTPGDRPERVWLTVVNDVRDGKENILKDPRIVHEVLATPQARARHVADLLSKVGPADGLDIDYEGLNKEDGEAFSLFIEELSRRLHAAKKLLSVTVEPKTTPLPGNGARAIEWKRIGAAADQVRVMAYFYHSPRGKPGPIAPLSWLSNLAQFALQRVPPEKLAVILTVNGLDWPEEGRARGVRFSEAEALQTEYQVKRKRDSASQSPNFRYQLGGDAHHIWYEDATSLRAKIRRLQGEGVQKIGFWQLGSGDPAFWKWLSEETSKQKESKNSSGSGPSVPPSRHSS